MKTNLKQQSSVLSKPLPRQLLSLRFSPHLSRAGVFMCLRYFFVTPQVSIALVISVTIAFALRRVLKILTCNLFHRVPCIQGVNCLITFKAKVPSCTTAITTSAVTLSGHSLAWKITTVLLLRGAHPKSINDWKIQILQNSTYQTYVQVSAFHPAHKRSSTPQVFQNSREHMPQYHRNPSDKVEGFQLFTIVNLKRRVGYHRTQATNSSIFFSFHRFQSFNYDWTFPLQGSEKETEETWSPHYLLCNTFCLHEWPVDHIQMLKSNESMTKLQFIYIACVVYMFTRERHNIQRAQEKGWQTTMCRNESL